MTSLDFSTEREPLTAFSLAGLTDIVLLLLIFFLLTSNFIPQFGIQVNLPEADASVTTEAQYVTVVITKEGRFYVEGELTERDGLVDAMRTAAAQGRTSVVLRADQEATVAQFARVASVAKALDLAVKMATEREELTP